MKPEQPAAPPASTFNSVKEVDANMKARMEKAVSDLQHEMAAIRTGRASLGILDHVRVDYYGTPTPLNQVANLHVPEPSLITIQPWDVSQIGPIEKAIRISDLGLNPANDGKIIRLPIPPLTEERRKELVKKLHAAAEHHRVSVRNIRRDGNENVKKLLLEQTGDSGLWPDDAAFREAWLHKPLYGPLNNPKLVHLFTRLNRTYMSPKSEALEFADQPSVEHLMPQEWIPNWRLPDGSKGLTFQELYQTPENDPRAIATRKRDNALQCLGNLTILSTGLNSAQKNYAWDQKLPVMLRHSLLPLNQTFADAKDWDEDSIRERGKELFTRALQIWVR